MSVRVLLLVTSVALLGFAPAPFPKPERQREVFNDVNGTWEFEKYAMSGTSHESLKTQHRIEMTKEKFTFVATNGGGRTEYIMRMDPTASPPSFTWTRSNSLMFVGSYRVQNGKVEMIFQSGNNLAARPTDFTSKPAYHYVLRRIKR